MSIKGGKGEKVEEERLQTTLRRGGEKRGKKKREKGG